MSVRPLKSSSCCASCAHRGHHLVEPRGLRGALLALALEHLDLAGHRLHLAVVARDLLPPLGALRLLVDGGELVDVGLLQPLRVGELLPLAVEQLADAVDVGSRGHQVGVDVAQLDVDLAPGQVALRKFFQG
jgi:hypothetical protein